MITFPSPEIRPSVLWRGKMHCRGIVRNCLRSMTLLAVVGFARPSPAGSPPAPRTLADSAVRVLPAGFRPHVFSSRGDWRGTACAPSLPASLADSRGFRIAGGALRSPVADRDGTIVAATASGGLLELDEKQKVRWKLSLGSGRAVTPPVIGADGTRLVAPAYPAAGAGMDSDVAKGAPGQRQGTA